jgi:iron complex outermembrane receptor protein
MKRKRNIFFLPDNASALLFKSVCHEDIPQQVRDRLKTRRKAKLIGLLFLLTSIRIFAQDTLASKHNLDAVEIIAPIKINPGVQYQNPDSLQKARAGTGTLTDLLAENGIIFLKSYGGGNLATTAMHGASASQTPVTWNGINLQSPTNGNVDLSLMPAILCDFVSLQNGGNDGAIGGIIKTGSYLQNDDGFRVRYSGLAGSFGQFENGIKLSYSDHRFCAGIRAYHQTADNNFEFRNLAISGYPKDTVTNSDFLQKGIYGELYFTNKNENQFWTIKSWYQNSDRGIPPTMLESEGTARQKDEFFRSVASYHLVHDNFQFELKSALFTEFMSFNFGFSQPSSFTHALSLIHEAKIIYTKNKFMLSAGINDAWSQADVTQFVPVTSQNRAAAFADINFFVLPKLQLNFSLKEEEVEGKFVPLVGSFGGCWNKYDFLALRGSVSRNYRIPTFNDLYWVPGGNPDLKPEDSWNEDLSADFHSQYKKIKFSYIVSVYNRNTKNWILWQPGPGYWSPENLLEVWSRGVDHRVKINWKKNKTDISFYAGYEYVRATSEKSKAPNDVSIGKQLTYLPANHFSSALQFTYHNFYIAGNYQHTDLVFTTTDHTEYLPGYGLVSTTIGSRINFKSSFADIFFRVNNLTNKEYQAVAWRPMPGRSFQLGLTLEFHSPLKEKQP